MKKFIVIALTGLFFMFTTAAFSQSKTNQRKSKTHNIKSTSSKLAGKSKSFLGGQQDGTGIRRKNPKSFHGGHQDGTGIRRKNPKSFHGGQQEGTGIRKKNPKQFIGGQQDGTGIRRKNPAQLTSGTIPVYKNGKNTAKRKRTPVKNSFESQTQPFADGKVKGKNDPEAKPALLEFPIPEKIVSDNKHPEGQYSRKEADSRKSNPKPKRTNVKKSNGITILDQDTQTVVAPRKRKRNK